MRRATARASLTRRRHRPIGLGVQGLADAFVMLRLPFESEGARLLNKQIFETIYHAALEASMEAAIEEGPYETYAGSPVSKGVLQYDMWGVTPTDLWDWAKLKADIAEHGVRNSLLVAPMPTASTAQILGNNESIEPFTSNVYARRVLSGEFQVVNKHLLKDMVERGLWTDAMKNRLIAENGSVQRIAGIPDDIKALYKTVWEISQKTLIDMAADRGAFIDQSQSFNVHVAQPTFAKLTSMHFYAWKKVRWCVLRRYVTFLVAGAQDGHVLPAHAPGRRGHQVHGGPDAAGAGCGRQAHGGGEAGVLEGESRGLPHVQRVGPLPVLEVHFAMSHSARALLPGDRYSVAVASTLEQLSVTAVEAKTQGAACLRCGAAWICICCLVRIASPRNTRRCRVSIHF